MEVAEMVLAGAINKEVADWITRAGGHGASASPARTAGWSPPEGDAHQEGPRLEIEQVVDLGFVGEPEADRHARCSRR